MFDLRWIQEKIRNGDYFFSLHGDQERQNDDLTIAEVEDIPIGEAVYFSFITGLTVGYGDIVPNTTVGRIVCVALGFIGIIFSGLVVAITVHAVRESWQESQNSD